MRSRQARASRIAAERSRRSASVRGRSRPDSSTAEYRGRSGGVRRPVHRRDRVTHGNVLSRLPDQFPKSRDGLWDGVSGVVVGLVFQGDVAGVIRVSEDLDQTSQVGRFLRFAFGGDLGFELDVDRVGGDLRRGRRRGRWCGSFRCRGSRRSCRRGPSPLGRFAEFGRGWR